MAKPVVPAEERATSAAVIPGLEQAIVQVDVAIKTLEARRREFEDRLGKHRLTAQGVAPCAKCNRLVPSPCHDAEGFYGDGPWDFSCKEIFEGERP